MRILIVGAGHVGLVTGACLAKLGNQVTLQDTDEEKLKMVKEGRSPFYEKGLNEILSQVQIGAISVHQKTTDSDVIFICVGTHLNEAGYMSSEHVCAAAQQIAEALTKQSHYCLVVVRSTVAPGTTEDVVIPILETSDKKLGDDFGVCMNPEFLQQGEAIHNFMNPDRMVIGEYDKRSGDMLLDLYRDFNVPILRTNLRTAEIIKLASNAFLAAKISLINEIGNICKRLDIDVYEVAKGMGYDDRIGSKFLKAGIGFGGSCLPKDVRALIEEAKQIGYEPEILEKVMALNEKQALKPVELVKKHISLKGAAIGIMGLAFKAGTDDVRGSRAIPVVQALLQEAAIVKAYDPMAMENFRELFPQVDYVTKEEVLNCDAILIITEWQEFNDLDYTGKIVIDGRRVLKATEAAVYEGVCW